MMDGRHCATWQFLVTGTMRHFECNMPIILTDIVIYTILAICCCRCFPVYIGGSNCTKGLSTTANKRLVQIFIAL